MSKCFCKDCEYFSAYFKQCASSYSRVDMGMCNRYKRTRSLLEGCEDFKDAQKREKILAKLRLEHLDKALNDISLIAQILRDTQENS